jgi:hypothetical protein
LNCFISSSLLNKSLCTPLPSSISDIDFTYFLHLDLIFLIVAHRSQWPCGLRHEPSSFHVLFSSYLLIILLLEVM